MPEVGLYAGFDWDEGNARKNEKHGVIESRKWNRFFSMRLCCWPTI
jgi:hypothetical protein